jgi:hypothetical protein
LQISYVRYVREIHVAKSFLLDAVLVSFWGLQDLPAYCLFKLIKLEYVWK